MRGPITIEQFDEYCTTRMASMCKRPLIWGNLAEIEAQVQLMLELEILSYKPLPPAPGIGPHSPVAIMMYHYIGCVEELHPGLGAVPLHKIVSHPASFMAELASIVAKIKERIAVTADQAQQP